MRLFLKLWNIFKEVCEKEIKQNMSFKYIQNELQMKTMVVL